MLGGAKPEPPMTFCAAAIVISYEGTHKKHTTTVPAFANAKIKKKDAIDRPNELWAKTPTFASISESP